jgi:hypothetical protein
MPRHVVAALALAIVFSACSQPPDKEHQQAVGALEAARAAGAETYATPEFLDAQAALKRYDDSVAQRDYRQALNNALEARDLAYDAAKQAANKKAELRSQAERLAGELETLVTNATTRLTATNARLAAPAAARLRTARDAGRASLQEARTSIRNQAYAEAVAKLTPAVDHLRREMPANEPPAAKRKK